MEIRRVHPALFSSNSYLGFDHAATLFHIQDSPADPVERPIYLTNTFSFAILIHDVLLPEEARTMFQVRWARAACLAFGRSSSQVRLTCFSLLHPQVHNFSSPVLILPNESGYIFTLFFMPSTSSMHIDNNILLVTNASKFHLPVRVYTGFLDVSMPLCFQMLSSYTLVLHTLIWLLPSQCFQDTEIHTHTHTEFQN